MSRRFAIAALVMVSALSGASSATAAVYWGNGSTIGAANLDGRLRQPTYYRPDPETYGQIGAVAVSPDYLYWGGRVSIGRVPLFGPEVPAQIIATQAPVNGLAVDGAHIYWTTTGGEAIGRAGLDGAAANPQLVAGLKDARGVAVDSQHLYWTATTAIGRSDLDGRGVERAFRETSLLFPAGITVGGGNLYWGYNGDEAIERAPAAGGTAVSLVANAGPATALALDAGNVYWALGFGPGAVGRAALDGSLVDPHWLPSETTVSGVAVDALPSPPPLPPVSSAVEIVGVKHERRSGAIFVDVSVPATGRLQVVRRRFAWKILGKPRRQPEISAGRWRLKLWPGKGAIAAPIRRRLSAKGRAPSQLVISFEEPGKDPSTVAKRIVFARSRGL